jgi:hypothetical protein
VLKVLERSLVPGGALVMSMVRGEGEGYDYRPTGQRYTACWEYDTLAPVLEQAGFTILSHYYRPPGQAQQSWVVIVAQRPVGLS